MGSARNHQVALAGLLALILATGLVDRGNRRHLRGRHVPPARRVAGYSLVPVGLDDDAGRRGGGARSVEGGHEIILALRADRARTQPATDCLEVDGQTIPVVPATDPASPEMT